MLVAIFKMSSLATISNSSLCQAIFVYQVNERIEKYTLTKQIIAFCKYDDIISQNVTNFLNIAY